MTGINYNNIPMQAQFKNGHPFPVLKSIIITKKSSLSNLWYKNMKMSVNY